MIKKIMMKKTVIIKAMIKDAMIKKMIRPCAIALSVLFLYSCATVDERFTQPEDATHPGMQVFLSYQKAITSDSKFDDELKAFFSAAGQKRIAATQGWHRLVYTASFRALKDGSCDEITILKQSATRILVSCKGPYYYHSAFGFSRDEKMHLRVNVRKVANAWYIDTASLKHTMDGGQSVPRSIGLKFSD